MVEMQQVKSSNIEAIGYDPASRELHVKFRAGGTYVYHNISPDLHSRLRSADSIGRFLAEHVKPHHTHRKLL